MTYFIEKLKNASAQFTHSQCTIAEYIQGHVESIAFCTLEELASQIGVSTTTVIRFSRVLGYQGFTDMQQAVKDEIQNKASLPERLDDLEKVSGNALLRKSFALDEENLVQTLAAQKDEDLERAVSFISNADKVYLLGMRSSYSLAYYMASRLGEIRPNVHLIHSIGMLYPEEIVSASAKDVCIAYMFPRYSKAAIHILGWMKEQGIRIVLFTAMNNYALSSYADVLFPCVLKSLSYKNSIAAPVCLSNYLVTELVTHNYDQSRLMLSKTEDILSKGYYIG